MSHADHELVRRMLAGDELAFDEFFGGYFPGLFRFALARIGGDQDAAEEIVQATLGAAMRKLSTYRGEAALFTWLCTFCRHEIARHFRRSGRELATVALVEDDPALTAALSSLASGAEGQEASMARAETARLVHVVLDRLPPRYASALEWKYIDGIAVKEIAARWSLSEKAAESMLTRAREAFRDGFAMLTRARAPEEKS